jgi:hypothetical protein
LRKTDVRSGAWFCKKAAALAVIIVVAGSSILLWSRTSLDNLSARIAAMPSLLELHVAVGVHKLPVQDVEDQSLVYPAPEKH